MSTAATIPHPGISIADSSAGLAGMNREQFASAFDHGYWRTTKYLVSRGLQMENAEEFAQAAWANGWEHRKQLRDPSAVVSWVNSIAMNLFRRTCKRMESVELLPKDLPPSRSTGPGAVDLFQALSKCSGAERELIEKYYEEGYTSPEIAEQAGCTATAIRVRLCRLRQKLRPGVVGSETLRRRTLRRSA